jgi:hypothetical protein
VASQQESVDKPSRIEIDAEELISALQAHGQDLEYFLDRSTGDIVFLADDDVVEGQEELRESIEEDPDRYIFIQPIHSSVGWQIMADFIEALPNGRLQDALVRAVKRSHPFRSFKDKLLDYPDVRERWFAFENDRMLELAKEWLDDEGVDAELKTRASA